MTPLFLGVVPAAAFMAALVGRPRVPTINPGPIPSGRILASDWEETANLRPVWQGLDWQVGQIEHGGKALLVVARSDHRPWADLILYWVPEGSAFHPAPRPLDTGLPTAEGRQLPAEAVFLGPLSGTSRSIFEIPAGANARPGKLTVYSLPYRRVAAVSKMMTLH